MKLYIDTTDNKKSIIKFDDKQFIREYDSPRGQSVLDFLDETLKSENKNIDEISEIEVATGPGSFTGIRVGVSVAQALGYSLQVPVNGNKVVKKPIEIKYE